MKNLLKLSFLFVALLGASSLSAQKFGGLDKSPADIASYPTSYKDANKIVKIVYSRPQLKGRDLETLAPSGKVWRTGANEATEITFYKDVTFGNKKVSAGTNSLFTIPGETEWTLILNKNLNQWGAYSYENAADVVRVQGKVSKGSESLEAFSIAFNDVEGGAELVMGWGTARITTPIKS